MDAIRNAEEKRYRAIQERAGKGNRVYTELIDLADTGKNLFKNTDEARYNDYVMIDSKAGPPADNGNPPA